MQGIKGLIFILVALASTAWAGSPLKLSIKSNMVDPLVDSVELELFSEADGIAKVSIYSSDGFVVRTLPNIAVKALEKKKVLWNGRDQDNVVLPQEVYFPRVKIISAEKELLDYHPLVQSGGEPVYGLPVQLNKDSSVSFRLNEPTRVLIRGGIDGGAMLKNIVFWESFPRGLNRVDWDGKISGGYFNAASLKGFKLIATGYRTPESAIFILNRSESYKTYCKNKQSEKEFLDLRNDYIGNKKLSKHFEFSKCNPGEPEIDLNAEVLEKNQLKIEVNLPKYYLERIPQDLFEIGIYIDNEFVSELEQGYLPFFWKKDTSHLKKGKHWITVNITGYFGHIATSTVPFEIQ